MAHLSEAEPRRSDNLLQSSESNDETYVGPRDVPKIEGHHYLSEPPAPPVFFIHCWRTGTPRPDGLNTVYVDYSAARLRESLVPYPYDEGKAI